MINLMERAFTYLKFKLKFEKENSRITNHKQKKAQFKNLNSKDKRKEDSTIKKKKLMLNHFSRLRCFILRNN